MCRCGSHTFTYCILVSYPCPNHTPLLAYMHLAFVGLTLFLSRGRARYLITHHHRHRHPSSSTADNAATRSRLEMQAVSRVRCRSEDLEL